MTSSCVHTLNHSLLFNHHHTICYDDYVELYCSPVMMSSGTPMPMDESMHSAGSFVDSYSASFYSKVCSPNYKKWSNLEVRS